jgi:hypothetical protein
MNCHTADSSVLSLLLIGLSAAGPHIMAYARGLWWAFGWPFGGLFGGVADTVLRFRASSPRCLPLSLSHWPATPSREAVGYRNRTCCKSTTKRPEKGKPVRRSSGARIFESYSSAQKTRQWCGGETSTANHVAATVAILLLSVTCAWHPQRTTWQPLRLL